MTLDIYDTYISVVHSEKGQTLSGWNGKIKDLDAEMEITNSNSRPKLFTP
jgi:hypothetical protein